MAHDTRHLWDAGRPGGSDETKEVVELTQMCMVTEGTADYIITGKDYGQGGGLTLLPVSVRKEKHGPVENRPFSAIEVLTQFYGEDLRLALGNYVHMEQDTIQAAGTLRDAQAIRLLSYYYRFTESRICQPVKDTVVDFIVYGRLEADDGRRETRDFRIRYILDMCPCRKRCIGPVINMCSEEDPVLPRYAIRTDKYLIPIISSQDYDRIAVEIINTCFPEAQGVDDFVPDAEELAARMGLKVRDVRFADPSILGQIYYDSADAALMDDCGVPYTETMKSGDLLISKDNCNTPGIRNGTIVHECCHMYLDRWFFLLQMMTGQPYTVYTNRRKRRRKARDGVEYPKVGEMGWMELHCEKMPAHILMEKERTKKYIDGVLYGSNRPADIRRAVSLVADHYRVSRSMAKYRMAELGYAEAEGVNVYVDGCAIPDHGCAGKWPEGVTYTVSAYEAAMMCSEDGQLEAGLRSGRFRYIEGHICLNDAKFITSDRYGNTFLTPYARSHIDECCMAFRPNGRYKSGSFRGGQAARNKREEVQGRYCAKYTLDAAPDERAYVAENTFFSNDSLLWGELLYEMSDSYKEAVLDIMKKKGVTQEALSLSLGVGRKVVYNFLNAEQPSLGHLVGVCVALKLPYYISMKLVDRAGLGMRRTELHHLYRQFLLQSGTLTVERCNDILAEKGYPPLFRGDG